MRLEDQSTVDQSVLPEESQTLKAGVGEHRGEAASEPQQLDRFELETLLGQGGMGQVWEAWDPQLERRVAIKRLLRADPAARRRFMREGRLQATLAHPGICPVFEVGQDAGEPYLVMPRLDGVRLDEAVEGEPLEFKLDLMRQVAEAVHAAHQQGLIHRDLKPANILVEQPSDAPPRPVVLDFGIARPVGGEMLTAPGEVVGTPAFMAPEQVEGVSVLLDRRTDVYALGATLYRLLTGRPPHSGKGTPLLLSIVHEEPERLPSGDIPAEVEAIVFKCLEKDKNRRYDSARALAEDLGRYLAGEPVHARPVTQWIRFGKWMRRHRVAVRVTSAAAMLAVAGLAWGGWSAWRSGERQDAARRFGAQVEEIEALARYSHLVPLHDVREDQKLLRTRLDAIRPSLDDRDPVVRALASHAMGRGHLALDELEEAREYLETAYELDPENAEIAADLGRTLSEIYRDQLVDLERYGDQAKRAEVSKQLSDQLTRTLGIAIRLQEKSKTSSPRATSDSTHEGSSYKVEDSVELDVLVLFHGGQFEQALEVLANTPQGPSWMYERWRLEGDIRRSWAVSIHHNEPTTEKEIAKIQLEEARKAYKRALEVAPSHTSILLDEAQTLSLLIILEFVSLKEAGPLIEEARQLLQAARLSNPYAQDSWLWSVRLELTAATHAANQASNPEPHVESAISLGKQALNIHDRSSELWYELARAHELIGRKKREAGRDPSEHYALASEGFARVESTRRDYAYFSALGVLRLEMANYRVDQGLEAGKVFASAMEAFRAAAELHSKPFPAWFNLGVTLFNSANLDKRSRKDTLLQALEVFQHAQNLNPNSMFPFYYIGLTHQRLAQEITQDNRIVDPIQVELAVTSLKRATEISPDRVEPWSGLAAAIRLQAFDAFYRGQDAKNFLVAARNANRRALELSPRHPIVLFYSAQVEILEGKLALREQQDPTSSAQAAVSLCQQALNAIRDSNALYCLAEALSLNAEYAMSLGETQEAGTLIARSQDLFEQALENKENHLESLYSYPHLLLLEARRLRQLGLNPKPSLDRAAQIIDQAVANDAVEITTSLVKCRWLSERILFGKTTPQDAQKTLEEGRRLAAEVLERAPESPEALQCLQQLRMLS